MSKVRRRTFAGPQIRALRSRLGLAQASLARALGISVPYLSQIETNDRPVTPAVLLALARVYPEHWGAVGGVDEPLIVAAAEAAGDASVPEARMEAADIARAVDQQPALARRLVALHDAWRRAQEQLRVLDEAIDTLGAGEGTRLPWEEVRDWFHAQGNYIDAIDRAGERLAARIPPGPGGLAALLHNLHGVRVAPFEAGGGALWRYDASARLLETDRAQPPESEGFAIALHLARLSLADEIEAVVAASGLSDATARALLAAGLANYAAGAVLMPYGAFRAAAVDVRHDIDRLRQRFGVSFEQACHRLSTLQRPGALGIPMFFLRVDMAGNITKRHSATRLQFARFGGACPLWVVHEAVAIPDRILLQRAEMPDGTRYVVMAKGLVKPSGRFDRPPRRYAVALGCEEGDARDFVYADGFAPGGAATPIGVSCRICPRDTCDQRAFPPAGTTLHVDPQRRAIVPYRIG